MKIGDLVTPEGYKEDVKPDWVGIIVDFTDYEFHNAKERRLPPHHPVVYWNEEYHAEIEDPRQIEVIS